MFFNFIKNKLTMKYILTIALFTTLLSSNLALNTVIVVLSSEDFKTQIENKKVQLIDVRTPKEYKSSNINGAKNIDFYSKNFNEEFNKLKKDKAVYIYCRSGSRSRKASHKLVAMGFTEIYDLKGGISNYK